VLLDYKVELTYQDYIFPKRGCNRRKWSPYFFRRMRWLRSSQCRPLEKQPRSSSGRTLPSESVVGSSYFYIYSIRPNVGELKDIYNNYGNNCSCAEHDAILSHPCRARWTQDQQHRLEFGQVILGTWTLQHPTVSSHGRSNPGQSNEHQTDRERQNREASSSPVFESPAFALTENCR
jgi:hypothetical protein